MAFNQQIKRLNLKANRKIELRPEIEELDATDSFAVSNAICALLKKGVYGIIGMSNASALSTIQSYSNTFQVPFIALGMAQNTSNHGPYQLFMRPLYTEGLLDVILEYKWDHILYVYDTDEGLIRLQQLFQVVNIRETTIDIDVKRVSDPYACFDMLKNLTKKFEKRLHRVLLDMSTEKAADVILKIINSSDVPNDKFHFLLGELRIEEMKYHSFSKGGMNITGFQLLNSTDLKKSNEHEMLLWDWPDETITLEAAMVIDAVNLFKRALNQLETRRGKQPNRYPINVNFRQNVKCTDSTYVSPLKGTNMTEILKSVEFDGLTGKVNFDERGFRDKFTLYLEDIIISRRLSHVGSWSRSRRLNLHEPIIWRQRQSNESRPRNITTILEAPYVMYKDKETEERKPTCGVENFIGFCIDLLLAVVKELDLDYELCIVGDGSFGTQLENGTWNGMIGELVRQEKPYMMYKDPVHDADRENAPKCGKQYFEGFCAELAQKVADLVGFEYELCLVGDGVYGEKLENGTWSGIIGELTREEKDLAVAPITITSTRERVVDFTKPYLSLGISIIIKKTSVKKASVFSFMDPLSYEIWMCILFAYIGVSVVLFLVSRFSIKKTSVKKASVFSFMDPLSYEIWMCILFAYIGVSVVLFLVSRFSIKKTSVKKASVFSFMDPLSYEIWMCILFAYIGVSVVLFLVSRFSPTEWHIEDGSNITNDFTISNSLWYSLGAFMQQGCDISPRSVSGRIVGSVWWFFTLIIISSYTANLAAFLTVERMLTPIESAEDLAKQTEIQYGTLQAGSTKDFFQYSKFPVYERMWAYMQSASPSVLVKNTDEGIRRVRNENYAYLIESTTNDYINMRKPCDTMKVGTNLDSKGYGIATPIGSDLRDKLTLAVLKLREAGDLEEMQKKWWDSRSECPPPSNSQDGGQQELTLSNVAGIFYILVAGLLLSVIIACLEFLYKSKLDSKRSKKSFGSVLRCKARLSFRGSLDRDTPASSTPLRKSMSTYTYTGPTQMVGNDGIPDNTHTQV